MSSDILFVDLIRAALKGIISGNRISYGCRSYSSYTHNSPITEVMVGPYDQATIVLVHNTNEVHFIEAIQENSGHYTKYSQTTEYLGLLGNPDTISKIQIKAKEFNQKLTLTTWIPGAS